MKDARKDLQDLDARVEKWIESDKGEKMIRKLEQLCGSTEDKSSQSKNDPLRIQKRYK